MRISYKVYLRDNLIEGAQLAKSYRLFEHPHWKMNQWYVDIIEGVITKRDAKLIIAFNGELPVGALLQSKYLPYWCDRNENRKFLSTYVKPDYRRKGIGTKMFQVLTKRETHREYVRGSGIYGSEDFFNKIGVKYY